MGETGSRGNTQTGVLSYRGRQRQNIFNTAMMHKLIFCCLIIVSFSCPLSSLPIINTSEMSYQLSADEDSRLNLERLGSPGSTSLIQFLPELLGTLTEDNKAGLTPSNYNPGEYIKAVSKLPSVTETIKIRFYNLNYTELLPRHHFRSTDFINSID
ncbi:urotensin-2 isoform X1 [Corapipo altera]|uniref:urotensin-2 isoform X1 n=1 Tax=Corapipo altera TaxID=415028 RepID=UPI000FD6278B|nr:urotensin-2 isoform X1 [Corapipo altera]